jgi:hypothetical protein
MFEVMNYTHVVVHKIGRGKALRLKGKFESCDIEFAYAT